MIPLTTLFDEYNDRSNLSEQKKPFEYIVPPPSRGVGTKMGTANLLQNAIFFRLTYFQLISCLKWWKPICYGQFTI